MFLALAGGRRRRREAKQYTHTISEPGTGSNSDVDSIGFCLRRRRRLGLPGVEIRRDQHR